MRLIEEFIAFIIARHQIYLTRERGEPKPWTNDPVLNSYRFCNIYRELDTVTKWIRRNWREPHQHHPDLWFAMVVARLVNWPPSLKALGFPLPWSPVQFKKVMAWRKKTGAKVFTGAYMIHAGPSSGSKADYLAQEVLSPMWEERDKIQPCERDTLASFHARLMTCKDMGSFMAAQVVADIKYTGILETARDWFTWAASGPGSKRGLNVVCGNDDDNQPWNEAMWLQVLQEVQYEVNKQLPEGWQKLHAQDIQNCLCEFYKYTRGYSRSKYPGRT